MDEAFRNVVSYTNRACTGLRSGTIDIAMIVPDMVPAKREKSLDAVAAVPKKNHRVSYKGVLPY
jgi:hypothetical protein